MHSLPLRDIISQDAGLADETTGKKLGAAYHHQLRAGGVTGYHQDGQKQPG